jgi:linoleoyl-CoA desaturase
LTSNATAAPSPARPADPAVPARMPAPQPSRAADAPPPDAPRVTFPPHSPLYVALRERVDAALRARGVRPDGGARLVRKTVVVLAWLAAAYGLLVFWAPAWWAAVPLTVALGLAVAAVGFNVQHDGGHDAFGATRRRNRLAAHALDLVGGSSYVWRYKHAFYHHHFTNMEGLDDDVEAGPFLRLAPDQARRPWHRLQHWYMWGLFAFLPAKWAFVDDFRAVLRGRVGDQRMPRPGTRDLLLLMAGKALYVGWLFALPLAVGHSPAHVLGLYALGAVVVGTCLSVIFQLAHCVEEADFPGRPGASPEGAPVRAELPWAEHQLATTVDFAPRSRVLGWYLGGLNMQVEHHLFPRVSHVHYPVLLPVVRETCAEFGVLHRSHPTFFAALRSHVRHVRGLGRAPDAHRR